MTRHFDHEKPIVLGLAGQALTGKTVTGNAFAPIARTTVAPGDKIFWSHLYFALPIYRMSSARQKIQGEGQEDRILYEIHDTLTDIFTKNPLFGAPPYYELIAMVQEIADLEYPLNSEEKPRTFLQTSGTICRSYRDSCFVEWMDRKIRDDFLQYQQDDGFPVEGLVDPEGNPLYAKLPYGVVVSDVRFLNEAESIHNHPNGILVKLTATEEVRNQRSIKRDGKPLTPSQAAHESEQQVKMIPEEWIDGVVDSSELSIAEEADAVKEIVYSILGV